MISSKWLVVLWSAFYAGHCFKQSCLIAPSYADEELSVVTCNSTHALLAWSLGLHTQGLSSLAFEYSCLNVTDDGLIPIVKNQSLPWRTDDTSGFTNIPLVPGATCLFSACYTAQVTGTFFVSPTGCLAAPAATSAQSVSLDTSILIFTDGLIATPALPFTTKSAPEIQAPKVVNGITFGVTVGIAVVVFIVIAALVLTIGLYAMRTLKRNAIKKDLRIIGVGLAEKVDISYAPVDVAISKAHSRGIHFTSQTSILDNLEKTQPAKSTELDTIHDVNALSLQVTHQSLCSEDQVEQICFPCEGYRKESFDTSASSNSSMTGYTAEN
ncbi:hypothetical protein EMCRGX_G023224 [Ephydatia muelleri]